MALIPRGVTLLAFWIVLSGSLAPADIVMGVIAAALGAWASLVLAPPRQKLALRPVALAILLLRLPIQVLVAGFDVAMRCVSLRPRLRPGLVEITPMLSPGPRRDGFLTLASLLPGSVPAGSDGEGRITIHALDVDQPVAAEIAREEAGFARAIGSDV